MGNAPRIGSWIWDMRTDQEEWSDSQYELFGYKPRSIKPTYDTFKQALHPDDRDRVLSAVAATLQQGAPYRVECRIYQESGDIVRVVCAGDVVRDAEGRPVLMAGTVVPVRRREEPAEVVLPLGLRTALERAAQKTGQSPQRLVNIILRQKIPRVA